MFAGNVATYILEKAQYSSKTTMEQRGRRIAAAALHQNDQRSTNAGMGLQLKYFKALISRLLLRNDHCVLILFLPSCNDDLGTDFCNNHNHIVDAWLRRPHPKVAASGGRPNRNLDISILVLDPAAASAPCCSIRRS